MCVCVCVYTLKPLKRQKKFKYSEKEVRGNDILRGLLGYFLSFVLFFMKMSAELTRMCSRNGGK